MIKIRYEKNTPRWFVFTLDLGIVLFSLLTAYLLRFNFQLPDQEIALFPISFGVFSVVRILGFYTFKPYSGIVRHASLDDFQRIFLSLLSGSIVLAILNQLNHFSLGAGYFIPYSILIIEFLVSFFLMGSLRIGVKILYHEIIRSSKDKTNIIIYGAGDSGLTTKRALNRVSESQFNVLAFFDDSKSKVGKLLEGSKIYNGSDLQEFLSKNEIDQMIIAIQKLPASKKNEIVEIALEQGVGVKSIPPVNDWINGELNVKQIKGVKIEDLLGRKQIQLGQEKIKNQLKGKVVLVTGAAGSIGSEIVRQVSHYFPEKILLLDQGETPMYELDLEMSNKYGAGITEVLIGDIRDKNRIEEIFHKYEPQVVYHAAAYKHVPLMEINPTEAIRTNVLGTSNLVDLADRYKVDKFVMVSTDKAVNPTNIMGASKRIAEIYAQAKNGVAEHTKYVTTRFGNVLGSNGSVIPLFKRQIEKGGPITVTHPEITRFFMTIPEACQLVLEAGMMGTGGEIFIFDMGDSVKILDLAKKMIKLSGLKVGEDINIIYTGLRPGEKLYEELLSNEENTLKTHHDQIMIAKVREYEFDEISVQLEEMRAMYCKQDVMELVKLMKSIVPEFQSKNSIFQKLDK